MKTWFITGANRGLGLAIARAALDAGDKVAATARKPDGLASALPGYGERLLPIALDVTDIAQTEAAAARALEVFGSIDVLVNNAGYGQVGAFEEVSAEAIERQFATNVFGTFHVTRALLPAMRRQRAGHIVTISSLVGLTGFDGSSIYCSSKFALEGWSESLGLELARFGIKVTLVEPGPFRTDFLDDSSVQHGDLALDDYAEITAGRKAALGAYNHQQAGDPEKLGAALLELVAAAEPPVRFAAGSDALAVLRGKAETLAAQAESWHRLSASTDF